MSCIVCGGESVEQFLDLGETALANKFLAESELDAPEPTYPLRVGFCHGCGHVQLTERVPPAAMFEDYLYLSSASDTLRSHLHELSDIVVARRDLGPGDLVIDIGCNDGTLLQGFARRGVRTLGVDPARNLAALAEQSGIDRYVGFFDSRSSREIVDRWGQGSVITATNTFPHIPELHDFMVAIDGALAPGGAFVIEAHYLVDMLEQAAFDTIYHEHVSYWALGPMQTLFRRHGMQAVHAERLPIHHGQLRVTVQRQGEGDVDSSVDRILERERELELDRFSTYEAFAGEAHRIKQELNETVAMLLRANSQIVGYGAPAKGSTLLSFLDLGPDKISYIVDRSPLKQGRYTPSSHIPVVAPERLLTDQPDYVLLLAWNFADEVLDQQADYRRRGGRFIIPVPRVQVV
jgi:cyclopropane fatty-acyl-phospholipid synthase-like methyltransferase